MSCMASLAQREGIYDTTASNDNKGVTLEILILLLYENMQAASLRITAHNKKKSWKVLGSVVCHAKLHIAQDTRNMSHTWLAARSISVIFPNLNTFLFRMQESTRLKINNSGPGHGWPSLDLEFLSINMYTNTQS